MKSFVAARIVLFVRDQTLSATQPTTQVTFPLFANATLIADSLSTCPSSKLFNMHSSSLQFLFAALLLCFCLLPGDSHASRPPTAFAATALSRRRHGARSSAYAPQSTSKVLRRADPTDHFSFSVTLKGKNMQGLTQKMYEISASNGHWLTTDQLKQYTAPKEEHAKAFRDWLEEHQVSEAQVKRSPLEVSFRGPGTQSKASATATDRRS